MKAELFLMLLAVILFSCNKKESANAPCQIISISDKTQNVRNDYFEYDSMGRMILMVRKWTHPVNGVSFNESSYWYNEANELTKSEFEFFLNDSLVSEGIETYVWDKGRIVRSEHHESDGRKGYVNYRYDSLGRLIESVFHDPHINTLKHRVEYDRNSQITKFTVYNKAKQQIYKVVSIPKGRKVKMPQSLWRRAGLPYDIPYSEPIEEYITDESVYMEYLPDDKGELVLQRKWQENITEVNKFGYVTKRVKDKDTIFYKYRECP